MASHLTMGQTARDVITGFEGVVVGQSQFLTGCDQSCLLPQGLDKDGKPHEPRWYDDNRLELQPLITTIALPTSRKTATATIEHRPGADIAPPSMR